MTGGAARPKRAQRDRRARPGSYQRILATYDTLTHGSTHRGAWSEIKAWKYKSYPVS